MTGIDAQHPAPRSASSEELTVIVPRAGWRLFNFMELWQFRELMLQLAMRDISVSYKQTLFGALWAVIPPLMLMLVFTLIFGKVAKFPTPVPYPLFVFAGLVPWQFFAKCLNNVSNSVVGAHQMIDKVYFPRLALPLSRLGGPVVDFALSILILIAMMLFYGIVPGWSILLLPILWLLIILAALGIGTFLAAVNVSFRDIRFVVPFMLQIAMFATPTIYMDTSDAKSPGQVNDRTPVVQTHAVEGSTTAKGAGEPDQLKSVKFAGLRGEGVVPNSIQNLLRFNPMSAVIGAFRASMLNRPIAWDELGIAAVAILVSCAFGCLYFHRMEDTFADVI